MLCTFCEKSIMMKDLIMVKEFAYCPECVPKDNDPIVETAIGLLMKGIEALKRNSRYNTTLNYSDYLTSGLQTSVDRVIEPLLRLHACGSYDQAVDCPALTALHCAWVLAGCPPSKIKIPTIDISLQPNETINNNNIPTGEAPTDHSFASKLTGDVE